jgi:hypothetical protein
VSISVAAGVGYDARSKIEHEIAFVELSEEGSQLFILVFAL